MIKAGMFLILIPRADSLYDAFIPHAPSDNSVAIPIRVPGAEAMLAKRMTVDLPQAIGLCMGAAAGLSGMSGEAFVKVLTENVSKLNQMVPGKTT